MHPPSLSSIMALTLCARQVAASSSARFGARVMSANSAFVPATSSRRALMDRTTNKYNGRTARSSSSLLAGRGPQIVMWGEEDAPMKNQPSIPFSSDSSGSDRPRRPARRSGGDRDGGERQTSTGGGGGGGGWYDDDGDGNSSSSYAKQRSGPSRRSSGGSSGGWDTAAAGGADDGWGGDYSGGGGESYEPYNYNKRNSDRPNKQRREGGRGGGGGGDRSRGRGGGDRSRGGGGRDSWSRGESRGGDRSSRGGGGGGGRDSWSRGNDRGGGRGGRGRDGGGREAREAIENGAVKINLKMIETAGYQHLYGIAPVLNALKADTRDFEAAKEEAEVNKEDMMEMQRRMADVDGIDGDGLTNDNNNYDEAPKKAKKIIKPEAALSPHLFIQEGTMDNSKRSFRSNAKKDASAEIIALAKENELPIVEVDKGVLNTLCMNRPHQGFVLRCGKLDFETVRRLPKAGVEGVGPKVWLALDEVVDPQNLGALLRSAYFLGKGPGIINEEGSLEVALASGQVGILVCSKNSSPLTPTVSAASAGALEFMTIYSTSNLPKLLNGAKGDGWRILGAAAAPDADAAGGFTSVGSPSGSRSGSGGSSASASDENEWDLGGMEEEDEEENDEEAVAMNDLDDSTEDDAQKYFELHQVETGQPTILVLGSEGRGLRTLVSRSCTGFVSIPGGGIAGFGADEDDSATQAGVDSLNVSVTGGILLWHFLSKLQQ